MSKWRGQKFNSFAWVCKQPLSHTALWHLQVLPNYNHMYNLDWEEGNRNLLMQWIAFSPASTSTAKVNISYVYNLSQESNGFQFAAYQVEGIMLYYISAKTRLRGNLCDVQVSLDIYILNNRMSQTNHQIYSFTRLTMSTWMLKIHYFCHVSGPIRSDLVTRVLLPQQLTTVLGVMSGTNTDNGDSFLSVVLWLSLRPQSWLCSSGMGKKKLISSPQLCLTQIKTHFSESRGQECLKSLVV